MIFSFGTLLFSFGILLGCLLGLGFHVLRLLNENRSLTARNHQLVLQNRRLWFAKARELGVPLKGDPNCPADAVFIVNRSLLEPPSEESR